MQAELIHEIEKSRGEYELTYHFHFMPEDGIFDGYLLELVFIVKHSRDENCRWKICDWVSVRSVGEQLLNCEILQHYVDNNNVGELFSIASDEHPSYDVFENLPDFYKEPKVLDPNPEAYNQMVQDYEKYHELLGQLTHDEAIKAIEQFKAIKRELEQVA